MTLKSQFAMGLFVWLFIIIVVILIIYYFEDICED